MSIEFITTTETKTKTIETKTIETKTIETKMTETKIIKTKISKPKSPIASLGQIRRFYQDFVKKLEQNPDDVYLQLRVSEYNIKLTLAEEAYTRLKIANVKNAIAIA
jgi:hypothetical protein